jgi:hypothetical protein
VDTSLLVTARVLVGVDSLAAVVVTGVVAVEAAAAAVVSRLEGRTTLLRRLLRVTSPPPLVTLEFRTRVSFHSPRAFYPSSDRQTHRLQLFSYASHVDTMFLPPIFFFFFFSLRLILIPLCLLFTRETHFQIPSSPTHTPPFAAFSKWCALQLSLVYYFDSLLRSKRERDRSNVRSGGFFMKHVETRQRTSLASFWQSVRDSNTHATMSERQRQKEKRKKIPNSKKK